MDWPDQHHPASPPHAASRAGEGGGVRRAPACSGFANLGPPDRKGRGSCPYQPLAAGKAHSVPVDYAVHFL